MCFKNENFLQNKLIPKRLYLKLHWKNRRKIKREKKDVDKDENEKREGKDRTGGVAFKTNKPVTY
jgi:hypothetical protein